MKYLRTQIDTVVGKRGLLRLTSHYLSELLKNFLDVISNLIDTNSDRASKLFNQAKSRIDKEYSTAVKNIDSIGEQMTTVVNEYDEMIKDFESDTIWELLWYEQEITKLYNEIDEKNSSFNDDFDEGFPGGIAGPRSFNKSFNISFGNGQPTEFDGSFDGSFKQS